MEDATAEPLQGPLWVPATAVFSPNGCTRSKTHRRFLQASFNWVHWEHAREAQARYSGLRLPTATEPCGSVTTTFLLVMRTLFEVERLRGEHSRNILQLLAANECNTKLFKLSPGSSAAAKQNYIEDEQGIMYTSFMRQNVTKATDQHLAKVILADLERLELCPCLVDVAVLDKSRRSKPVVVSAGMAACSCASDSQPASPASSFTSETATPIFFSQLQAGDAVEAETEHSGYRLKYQAAFHWEHYPQAQASGRHVKLPGSTPASYSAPRAFMKLLRTLYEVEQACTANPRNILQRLAAKSGLTMVANLYSSTVTIPDTRVSTKDTEGRKYSTTLAYNGDNIQQHMPAVVFFNLGYLGLCPCLVSIIITDTRLSKASDDPVVISAASHACRCAGNPLVQHTADELSGNGQASWSEEALIAPLQRRDGTSLGSENGSEEVNALLEATEPDEDSLDWLQKLDESADGSELLKAMQDMEAPDESAQQLDGAAVSDGESGVFDALLDESEADSELLKAMQEIEAGMPLEAPDRLPDHLSGTAMPDGESGVFDALLGESEGGSELVKSVQQIEAGVPLGLPDELSQQLDGAAVSDGESGVFEALLDGVAPIEFDSLFMAAEPEHITWARGE